MLSQLEMYASVPVNFTTKDGKVNPARALRVPGGIIYQFLDCTGAIEGCCFAPLFSPVDVPTDEYQPLSETDADLAKGLEQDLEALLKQPVQIQIKQEAVNAEY